MKFGKHLSILQLGMAMVNQHASGVNWRRSLDLAARSEVLRPLLEAGADKNAAGMSAASCLYIVV